MKLGLLLFALGVFLSATLAQRVCPPDNDGLVVHFPHEDCTKFYKCDWGELVEQDCPPGLHFNAVLSVCDWPENANCDGTVGVDPTLPPATLPPPTLPPATLPPATLPPATLPPATLPPPTLPPSPGVCPPNNDGLVVHFPHEDCTKFYKCDWGELVEQDCPPGLHFNAELSVCDWPENANCDGTVGVIPTLPPPTLPPATAPPATLPPATLPPATLPPPTLPPATLPPATLPPATLPPATLPPPTLPPSPGVCPPDNDGLVVHFPHEDCTKFYKCDWGELVEQDCPPGLHFNAELSVCDWPENANCDGTVGVIPTLPPPTLPPPTLPPPTLPPPTLPPPTLPPPTLPPPTLPPPTLPPSPGVCPPNNDGLVVHLPHETDCTLFYKCDWGEKVLQECPPGLYFNSVLSVCDWPEYANCVL